MKPAACSCRVNTSRIDERDRESSRSRFSSPGIPKTYSTPSASRQATNRSETLVVGVLMLRTWCAERGAQDKAPAPGKGYFSTSVMRTP